MELRKITRHSIPDTAIELVQEAGRAAISDRNKANLLARAVACQALSEAPDPDWKAMGYLAARIAQSNPWLSSARTLAKLISAKK